MIKFRRKKKRKMEELGLSKYWKMNLGIERIEKIIYKLKNWAKKLLNGRILKNSFACNFNNFCRVWKISEEVGNSTIIDHFQRSATSRSFRGERRKVQLAIQLRDVFSPLSVADFANLLARVHRRQFTEINSKHWALCTRAWSTRNVFKLRVIQ